MMRRREFLSALGVAAFMRPLAARAQQVGKLPIIGFLGANTASSPQTDAFVQRLRELGWIDGRTVAIEYRWAEGRFERAPALVAELIQLKVDVLVTHAGTNIVAAKQATSTIPIVFAATAGHGRRVACAIGIYYRHRLAVVLVVAVAGLTPRTN